MTASYHGAATTEGDLESERRGVERRAGVVHRFSSEAKNRLGQASGMCTTMGTCCARERSRARKSNRELGGKFPPAGAGR
jgi:hypothetical protein